MIPAVMRILVLAVLSGTCLVRSAEPTVEQWLTGATNSVPFPGSEAGVAEHLSAIREALAAGGQRAERAWTLVFNLGPGTAALYPEIRRAFLAVPKEYRRYRSGDAIKLLGPLAGDLLPELLPDPITHGLTWEQTIPLAIDGAVVVPGLQVALAGTDPAIVKDAALAVQWASWSPALRPCVPQLAAALECWQELPPIDQSPGILSFRGDPRDPDYQEDLRWAEQRTVPDPWPVVLVALAALAPEHPSVIAACRANLTNEAPAHRRRAALEALASLTVSDADVHGLAAPWLGPGKRGRLAFAALTRHGGMPIEVLMKLPKESAMAVVDELARQRFSARRQPLPPSWVPWLLEGGPSNQRYRELLPWCGLAGIDAAFQAGDDVATRAGFGLYESLAPPPTTMPTGLVNFLTGDDQQRRELARAVLMNGVTAQWMVDLVPELITHRVGPARSDIDSLLVARAADGDQRALAWLAERVSASDHSVIGLANWWRGLLPAEMREAIPPFHSTTKDTPGLLQALAEQPTAIVSVDRHALTFLWHHGVPEACWPGLLARSRGGRGRDALLPLLLMRDPRYRDEGMAMLRRELARSGWTAFNDPWYAGVRGAIPREMVEPWFSAGSPQTRRMAREVAEP